MRWDVADEWKETDWKWIMMNGRHNYNCTNRIYQAISVNKVQSICKNNKKKKRQQKSYAVANMLISSRKKERERVCGWFLPLLQWCQTHFCWNFTSLFLF